MERFATNKNGNIDSGTEVLANNMVFLQQAKANAISNMYGDLFTEGILNTGNPDTMFKISANNDGTFNVGVGVGYVKDITTTPSIYERIEIKDDTIEYNAANSTQLTPDGTGQNVLTPKSSGCKNIPIPNANVKYYIDIRYLNVCDNGNNGNNLNLKNYSIAKEENNDTTIKRKRFYKWTNGYDIVLVPKPQIVQGLCIGTISKDLNNTITITDENKSKNLLINSRIFIDYFDAGQGITYKEIGEQTVIAVNVDDKTLEINENNQIVISKDGLYPYTKFAINSGPSSFLSGSANNITVSVGENSYIWLSPAYANRFSITNDILTLNAWTQIQERFSQDTRILKIYTVCVNNTNIFNNNDILDIPTIELMGNIYVSKTSPIGDINNPLKPYDIWLDISSQPYKAKWYYSGNWLEYNGVPIGLVNWISTVIGIQPSINLFQFDFNKDYSKWDTLGDLKVNFEEQNSDTSKYIACDGSSQLKFLYNDLYRKIGDVYGEPTLTPEQAAIDPDTTHYFVLPDLREKTIIGSSTTYAVGQSGGEITHKLTIEEMPNHRHSGDRTYTGGGGGMGGGDLNTAGYGVYSINTTYVGGDQPHNNMQPYLALNYLIKYTV